MIERTILSVDQSTSATKAVLFDAAARPRHRVSLDHRQYYPEPGMVEHDPEEIYDNTVSCIARILSEADVPSGQVAALALTNQRETVVVWDGETGRPLHNAVVWQDQRGTELCRKLQAEGHGAEVRARTGASPGPLFLGEQTQVAAGPRPRDPGGGGRRPGPLRHHRLMACLEAHRRPCPRHGLLQRLPYAVVRPSTASSGAPSWRIFSAWPISGCRR